MSSGKFVLLLFSITTGMGTGVTLPGCFPPEAPAPMPCDEGDDEETEEQEEGYQTEILLVYMYMS